MSELPNARNMEAAHTPGEAPELPPTEALDLDCFTPQQMARLQLAHNRAAQGELNEWTDDFKRLRFARWLYEHGAIGG